MVHSDRLFSQLFFAIAIRFKNGLCTHFCNLCTNTFGQVAIAIIITIAIVEKKVNVNGPLNSESTRINHELNRLSFTLCDPIEMFKFSESSLAHKKYLKC